MTQFTTELCSYCKKRKMFGFKCRGCRR